MPKKKGKLTQAKQSERFQKAVRDLEDAGDLNAEEAAEKFEKAMGRIVQPKKPAK